MSETPQGFVAAEECRKAAWQNGYRRTLGQQDGWARYGSTTARDGIHLAAGGAGGPWYLALDHAGVIAELGPSPADMPGPGRARFAFGTLRELYRVLPRVYALAVSLPDAPLQTFLDKTRNLPPRPRPNGSSSSASARTSSASGRRGRGAAPRGAMRLSGFFAKLTPYLVGMEACGGAHHWVREIVALGHRVRPTEAVC